MSWTLMVVAEQLQAEVARTGLYPAILQSTGISGPVEVIGLGTVPPPHLSQ